MSEWGRRERGREEGGREAGGGREGGREGGRKREKRCCFMVTACVLVLGGGRKNE